MYIYIYKKFIFALQKTATNKTDNAEEAAFEKELQNREDQSCPMYHQVALTFADLHDNPVIMMGKKSYAISSSVALTN